MLKEIKQLEGTREKVVANDVMKAKIQDSLGQKDAIQDQVKVSFLCILVNVHAMNGWTY